MFSQAFFMFVEDNQKWKVVTKNEMNNPIFFDEENIPLAQDKDYDNYSTPNTSRVDETSFTMPVPSEKETTSTLRLKQKVKRDKLSS